MFFSWYIISTEHHTTDAMDKGKNKKEHLPQTRKEYHCDTKNMTTVEEKVYDALSRSAPKPAQRSTAETMDKIALSDAKELNDVLGGKRNNKHRKREDSREKTETSAQVP